MTLDQIRLRARAIKALVPTAEYAEVEGVIVRWDVAEPQPSEDAIAAKAAELAQADAVRAFSTAIDAHIEATARARDYASAVSAASYVTSTNPTWAAEAAAFVAWRDAVWAAVYGALGAWQAGGEAPTIEGLIASLPAMVWPGAAVAG
jgi:hypothetical protein